MSTPDNWSFETKQIHAGQTPDAASRARALYWDWAATNR